LARGSAVEGARAGAPGMKACPRPVARPRNNNLFPKSRNLDTMISMIAGLPARPSAGLWRRSCNKPLGAKLRRQVLENK
jgi:hypothetical protein